MGTGGVRDFNGGRDESDVLVSRHGGGEDGRIEREKRKTLGFEKDREGEEKNPRVRAFLAKA